jgi:hypothetical protein
VTSTEKISTPRQDEREEYSSTEIVISYLKSLERQDYKSARECLNDDLSFTGPLASYHRAEDLLKTLERLGRPKYEIKESISDGANVCLLYYLTTEHPPATVLTSGWYHLTDGKIDSITTVFDPRPFVGSH